MINSGETGCNYNNLGNGLPDSRLEPMLVTLLPGSKMDAGNLCESEAVVYVLEGILARALSTDPSLLVLDEPTSALDVSIQAKIINMLMGLQQKMGMSYLFITHDLSLIRNIADRVAIMYLGRIMEMAPTVDFFRNPRHPYTKMLLSSIPVVLESEKSVLPEKVISKGEIPSPVDIPSGCRFRTRCPYAFDKCVEVEPEMQEISKNHISACHLLDDMSDT